MSKSLVIAALTGLLGFGGSACVLVEAGPLEHEEATIDLDHARRTRVTLQMGVGELDVRGGSAKLVQAKFAYNVNHWKPNVRYTVAGSQGELEIRQTSDRGAFGNAENRWDVALNDAHPIDLVTHFGVGRATLSLGTMNLIGVRLHVGVGEVEVDLRGTPKESYRVDINGGVGAATIHVPSHVNIDARARGGIGGIDVRGLTLESSGRWVNRAAPADAPTIRLDIKGGVGEIRIVAG